MKSILNTVLLVLLCLWTMSMESQLPSNLPSEGLIAWYPFNTNANDESGNGLHGTVNGSMLVADRNGNANSAYSFDGIDDFITASVSLDDEIMGHTVGTLSLWFKSNLSSNNHTAFSLGNNTGFNDELVLSIPNYSTTLDETFPMMFRVTQDDVPDLGFDYNHLVQIHPQTELELSLFDGNWHNVIVVMDTFENRIYVDGLQVPVDYVVGNSSTQAFTNLLTANTLIVGAENNWQASGELHRFFEGQIDDIALYSVALTDNEISEWLDDTAVECVPDYLPTDDLVAYYPFCGNANDESGYGLDGTVNGATLVEDRNGNSNSAYSFDGIDDFITASVSLDDLIMGHTVGTLSLWFKSNLSGNNHTAFSVGNNSGFNDELIFSIPAYSTTLDETFPLLFRVTQDDVLDVGFDYNHLVQVHPQTELELPLFDGDWHNVIVVMDISENRIYIDGSQVPVGYVVGNSSTQAFTNLLTANTLIIGAENNWQASGELHRFFEGQIDDIAVYSTAFTDYEISEWFDDSSVECVPDYLPTNELVAWYPFCGDTDDESGNGLHGTAYGVTLTDDRNGVIDAAYSFDGIDDYIEIADTSVLDFGTGNFSVSFWVKKLALSDNSNSQGVNKWVGGDNPQEWSLSIGTDISDEPLFSIDTDQGTFTATSSQALTLDTWTNVTGVRNEEFILIYFNGQLTGSMLVEDAAVNNLGLNLLFGTIQNGLDSGQENLFAEACFDDIAIYSRALSPNEIASITQGAPLTICDDCTDNFAVGDLNCSGFVDSSDLLIFLTNFFTNVE